MNLRRPGPVSGDRGAALLMAVAALSIVAVLGAVLLADARTEVRRAERLVDRSESDHLVEIAVAEAWARIVDGETRGFTDSGTASTGDWSLVATPGDERWSLQIAAESTGDPVDARVTISREPLLPYTLVVDDARTGPLTGLVEGRVGIHGLATFGGRALGDVQELLGPTAQCKGCDKPIQVGPTDTSVVAPSLRDAACPAVDGVVTGELEPGYRYDCAKFEKIVIQGKVAAEGPVVLAFGPDVALRFDRAAINVGRSPSDFVITTSSTSDTAIEAFDSEFHGILSGPDSGLRTEGLRWEGAIVVRVLLSADGSELTGTWSDDLTGLGFGGWRVTEWRTNR